MRVVRPGYAGHSDKEYLGYYGYRLGDLRDNATVLGLEYPYPIYPQPGGVLPWAQRRGGDLYCWLTEGSDPSSWPVVAIGSSFEDWQTFPGPMCAHLLRILAKTRSSASHPRCGGSRRRPPQRRAIRDCRSTRRPANHETASLSCSRPSQPPTLDRSTGKRSRRAWAPASQATTSGSSKRPGRGPGATSRSTHQTEKNEFDLLALNVRTANEARNKLRHELFSPTGAPHGVLPWGTSAEGWTIGWAVAHEAPDEWGTRLIAPDHMLYMTYPDHSFSEFLLRFGPRRDDQPHNFAAHPWTGSREFRPHRPR